MDVQLLALRGRDVWSEAFHGFLQPLQTNPVIIPQSGTHSLLFTSLAVHFTQSIVTRCYTARRPRTVVKESKNQSSLFSGNKSTFGALLSSSNCQGVGPFAQPSRPRCPVSSPERVLSSVVKLTIKAGSPPCRILPAWCVNFFLLHELSSMRSQSVSTSRLAGFFCNGSTHVSVSVTPYFCGFVTIRVFAGVVWTNPPIVGNKRIT